MKRIRMRLPTREDWARYYDPSKDKTGLFCPTTEPPDVGKELRVEITFVGGPRLFVTGIVAWRRPQLNDPRARAGIGVKVHATDLSKLSYVSAWVRGGVLDKRELRRLPVRLRVTYSSRKGRRINFTRDISEEGVFVRCQELPDHGSTIKLVLAPGDDFRPLTLTGLVARLVDTLDERGMGVKLQFASDKQRQSFAELVRTLEERYLAGELPDEMIG